MMNRQVLKAALVLGIVLLLCNGVSALTNITDRLISTDGNFSGNYYIGNGSLLTDISGGGSGDITSVLFPYDGGLDFSKNATSGAVTAQLRDDCTNGQLLKNQTGGWVCSSDTLTLFSNASDQDGRIITLEAETHWLDEAGSIMADRAVNDGNTNNTGDSLFYPAEVVDGNGSLIIKASTDLLASHIVPVIEKQNNQRLFFTDTNQPGALVWRTPVDGSFPDRNYSGIGVYSNTENSDATRYEIMAEETERYCHNLCTKGEILFNSGDNKTRPTNDLDESLGTNLKRWVYTHTEGLNVSGQADFNSGDEDQSMRPGVQEDRGNLKSIGSEWITFDNDASVMSQFRYRAYLQTPTRPTTALYWFTNTSKNLQGRFDIIIDDGNVDLTAYSQIRFNTVGDKILPATTEEETLGDGTHQWLEVWNTYATFNDTFYMGDPDFFIRTFEYNGLKVEQFINKTYFKDYQLGRGEPFEKTSIQCAEYDFTGEGDSICLKNKTIIGYDFMLDELSKYGDSIFDESEFVGSSSEGDLIYTGGVLTNSKGYKKDGKKLKDVVKSMTDSVDKNGNIRHDLVDDSLKKTRGGLELIDMNQRLSALEMLVIEMSDVLCVDGHSEYCG